MTSNLVVHLRTALEQIAKRANHQPPSGLTTDHLVGYWQGRAEGICLEARAALENLPDETAGRLAVGTKVKVVGLESTFPTMPCDGWEIETIDEPSVLKYRVRHANGGLLDVRPENIRPEEPAARCTCFEDEHGPDCNENGCCGQCKGSQVKASELRVGDCLHQEFIPHPDGEVCLSCGRTRAELNGDGRQTCK